MIGISRRQPWLFWPNSICPSFSDKAAADILKGDKYYDLEIEFSFTGMGKKDLFGIVPNYTGFSVVDKRVFLGIGYHDNDEWFGLEEFIEPGKKHSVKFINKPNESLVVILNSREIYKADLNARPLAIMDNPQMFLGAAYWPTKDESDEIDFHLYKLIISSDKEMLAHHTFEKFIHSKSFDLTDNCNFLHKLR